jgi:DNA-binding MarR family transcriptional regulator
MTGGWGTRELTEEEWAEWLRLPTSTELSSEEIEVDKMLAGLHEAARFRRWATRILGEYGLRFSEWRVLRATDRAQRLKRDAVSQQLIARCGAIDEGSVAAAMVRLGERGLVDVGWDPWGWSYRVIMTEEGREALTRAEGKLARGQRSGCVVESSRRKLRGSRRSRARGV